MKKAIPPKTAPQKKMAVFNIRLDDDDRAALAAAAKDDGRPSANLARRVLQEWLKAKGYLK